MFVIRALRLALLLLAVSLSTAVAQQAPDERFKEVQVAASQFSIGDPTPSWVQETALPAAEGRGPVVMRLSDTQLLVGETPVEYLRRALQVNDAAALTAAGRFSIVFAPEYQHVQLHGIYIHRGEERLDRTKTSTIRFLQREQGLEQGVYSGAVAASILIDDLRVGDTLEIAYSVYGQNPVFAGKYSEWAGWDQDHATALRRVILTHPVARKVVWRMIGDLPGAEVTPKETIHDGMRTLVFEQRSAPEVAKENGTPRDFFTFHFLQFSEFTSWNEVAKWADKLFQDNASAGDEIKQVAAKIRTLATEEERVAAALEFVQSEIRYFSVSLGESSHRPEAPDVVLRRRYGDCKDKTLLLITLLRELGVDGKPVLLDAGRKRGLDKTLPSAQFFNHAIVQASVGGKTYFLDPTLLGQHGRLDRMGQLHEGTQILVVAPATTALSKVSSRNLAELVHQELDEQAKLPKFGGEGELQMKYVWRGLMAERMRLVIERSSHDQFLRFVGSLLETRYPGAKLVGEPKIEDDRVQNVFVMTGTYSIPKLALERDGNWTVAFRPDNMHNVLARSETPDRKTPLQIGAYPFSAKYTFQITLPDNVSAVQDPMAKTLENKNFKLSVSSRFRGNIAKVSLDMTTLDSKIEPKDYPKFVEDMSAMSRMIGGAFFISKSAIKSSGAPAEAELNARLRRVGQEAIAKVSETIKGGKLSGEDLAVAYCRRSEGYSDLGQHAEALADANKAVALAPNSTKALSCRGYANYDAGNFDKSIADYSNVISLGDISTEPYRSRGHAQFFAGHYAEARSDFTRATELADSETRLYTELWLLMTDLRMGQPAPPDLVKRAAAEASGDWPRPALAMLTRAISPEQMLKQIDKKKGDDRRMAQVEGYYYLAEFYLSTGDEKKARSYLEQVRKLGVIIYTEHKAAGFELERLNKPGATIQKALPEKRALAQ